MDVIARKITVRRCECGLVWSGGNSKYCDAGHAYRFTEEEFVPLADARGAVARVEALEKAIREHRLAFSNQGDEIDPDDETLWMALHPTGGQ